MKKIVGILGIIAVLGIGNASASQRRNKRGKMDGQKAATIMKLSNNAATPVKNSVKGPINEDFESGIPSTWTVTDLGGHSGDPTYNWNTDNPGGKTPPAGSNISGKFLICDSDNSGGGNNSLISTNSFDCSTADSVWLIFDHWYEQYSTPAAYVEVSTDGGTTWDTVKIFSASDTTNNEFIDLTPIAAYQSNVMVGFHYDDGGNWEWQWMIDNVKVTFGDEVGPTITLLQGPTSHFYTGLDDAVAATLDDPAGVDSAKLYYYIWNGTGWAQDSAPMTLTAAPDTYSATIPAQPKGTKLRYQIAGWDSHGNLGTSATYMYNIMPSGDNLIVYSKGSEYYPIANALIDNNIDVQPDYIFSGYLPSVVDSLPLWSNMLWGESYSVADTEFTALVSFLNAGTESARKHLMIYGDDIGYAAVQDSIVYEMYKDYLHSLYIQDDMSASTDSDTIVGVTGDPISNGIQYTINSSYPDMIAPYSPWDSIDVSWKFLIDINGDSTNTAGGIAYNGDKNIVVYLPYEVVQIDSQSFVDTLTSRVLNYFSTAGLPPMADWCNTQWPSADTDTVGIDTTSHTLFGQVYKGGVTDADTLSKDNFIVEIGVGPVGTYPWNSTWKWYPATFNSAHGNSNNNYEYMGNIIFDTTFVIGTYDYAFRYTYNDGTTWGPWVYADLDGSGNGYDTNQAGKLVIVPPVPYYYITEIQDTSSATFAGDTSNLFGQTVATSGVVTAVYSNGFFMEQTPAVPWGGIWIYMPGADTMVTVGDSVYGQGPVSEYNGLTEIHPDTGYIIASNVSLPTPITVSTASANDEQYESVLLKVNMATCTNDSLGYGEWEVNDGSGPLRVDDMGVSYKPDSGKIYNIVAPLYYSYGNYKLEPRDSSDITPVYLVINEVYYDSPGTDSATFIELKGLPGESLNNIHIFPYNGSSTSPGIYDDYDLTGYQIDPSGYFVVAQDSGVVNADTVIGHDVAQNGPDNVLLAYVSGTDTIILDAVGYGPQDTTTWAFVGEGLPAPDVASGNSLQRIPDGQDTNDNSVDFKEIPPTPGDVNGNLVVFEDNFDTNADATWWTGNWAKTAEDSHSPDSSYTDSPNSNYPNNSTLVGELDTVINLSGYYSATLTFWTRYWIEDGWDTVHLYISGDSGQTWAEVANYTGHVSTWEQDTIDISAFAGNPNVKIKFVLVSDQAVNYMGMLVDDIVVKACPFDFSPPLISHQPPTLDQNILGDHVLFASINDPSPIAYDTLYYKPDTASAFIGITQDSIQGSNYFYTIPVQPIGTKVEYYITAADTGNNAATTGMFSYIQGRRFIYDDNNPQYYGLTPSTNMYAVLVDVPQDTALAMTQIIYNFYYSPGQNIYSDSFVVHVWDKTFNDLITPFKSYPDTTSNAGWTIVDLMPHNGGNPVYASYGDSVYIGYEGISADSLPAILLDQPSAGQYHSYANFNDGNGWVLLDADWFIRGIGDYVSNIKESGKELKFAALPARPNPFRGKTVIRYALPASSNVKLDIFDITGRKVISLVNGKQDKGWHQAVWNGLNTHGRRVKSGIYFYKLNAGKNKKTSKMLLVR